MHKLRHQAQQQVQVQWQPIPRLLYQAEHQEPVSVDNNKKTHAWGKVFAVAITIFIISLALAFNGVRKIVAEEYIGNPNYISIPSIDVIAKIEANGLDEKGRMAAPLIENETSWWKEGAKPGNIGTAVIAAHLDTPKSQIGTFYNLKKLRPGDFVYITTNEGKKIKFVVEDGAYFDLNSFPAHMVYAKSGGRYLNLITCAGEYDKNTQLYNKRLVVFTRRLE